MAIWAFFSQIKLTHKIKHHIYYPYHNQMFTCLTVPSILSCRQATGTWDGGMEDDLLCCLSKPQRGTYHKIKSCKHITLLPLPPLGYGQD